MAGDRMFQVLVLGGMSLVGACGGQVGSNVPEAGTHDAFPEDRGIDATHVTPDAFPSETGVMAADAFPSETAQAIDAFPIEGPAMLIDSGPGPDAFPSETDQAFDASTSDAPATDAGHAAVDASPDAAAAPDAKPDAFPFETAVGG